jgi:DNA polymerase elongation subunit (family B)
MILSDAVEKIYYAIDAYYSFQEDKLYTIVKEYNPENDTYRKITKVIPSPKINIKVADFTKKVQYLVQYNKTESIEIGYKQYFMLKKQLESLYKGKPVKQSNLQKQFPDLLSFKKEIYDDYKVETQFLQKEIFDYSVNYIPAIDIAFWDIEVLTDDSEFPKASEAKYPINAIAIYYRKDDRVDFYCVLDKVRHKDKKRLLSEIVKKVEENITKFNILNIYFFDNESDLIINYLKNIKNVDVLVGWNSLTFDTLYIYNRCEQLGLSRYFTLTFGKLFEILNVVDSKDGMMASTYYTTKILSLDYIMLIKFFSAKKYPSHRLDYIAKAILNESDKSNELNQKVDVGNINKAYYNDLPTFALYNINDVILNKKIDDIVQFVSILFRFKSRLHGFTASLMSINNILDSYIALKAKENGLACISKIKTGTFYKDKIWYIYRTVNNLSDARIESINKIREENKTFSIFIDSNEVLSEDSGILSDSFIDEIPDEIQLSKLQVPFAWNEDKYPGAYVKKPKKGIYRNVVDFDASLPPWEKIYIKRDNKIHCYHIGSYKKETGDLVLSWDNMNNVCWSKVYDRIQHEWCGKLIKFTTR